MIPLARMGVHGSPTEGRCDCFLSSVGRWPWSMLAWKAKMTLGKIKSDSFKCDILNLITILGI